MGQGQRFDICCDRFGSTFWWVLDESLLWWLVAQTFISKALSVAFLFQTNIHIYKSDMHIDLYFYFILYIHVSWPVRHFLHYMVFILLGDFYLDVSFDKHLTQQDTIEPFWDETKERLEHLGSYAIWQSVWDTLQGTITYPTNGKGNLSSQLPFGTG